MASNRVSHFFDLKGPSMTVDTGCSTTLTALHQACQSLKSGDADMSIVGGSNLLINPDFFVSISSLGYAPDSFIAGTAHLTLCLPKVCFLRMANREYLLQDPICSC